MRQIRIAILTALALSAPMVYSAEPDYSALNALLAKHVKPGSKQGITANLVNYRALKSDPQYAAALQSITDFDIKKLASKREKMAFYINAYNIGAIKKVLEKYPTTSIRIAGDGVWKEPALTIAGKPLSLDAIENEILRKMGDARIHFAIVCASLSCPDLRREAYTAAKLEQQLQAQTKLFLTNPAKGIRAESNRVYQSAIFTWFAADFKDVDAFQRRYRKDLPQAAERAEIPYNWQLNE
ncbi:DUF547 domain-containing protein [Turneriella parva]|uniref:DUF547 domain-containing protein n=1 Tax=Turneriella parva (strain ATCC BAA-1111 / DSM 21527 / NCTC 11395 / H) TaxID=869212 RepID=I4B8I6_TURPD|nr:DUF547 domain-containing protein [Turneriella parva]AFM13593.1 protein of unknown function DUF547 [Turneriella parva DSM 21527]